METDDPIRLQLKQAALEACLNKYTRLGVAFSGGVDSTLLLAAARRVLGDRVAAFTAQSATHPDSEKEAAVEIARSMGIRHILFNTWEMEDPVFIANSPERCYVCKKILFTAMRERAAALGIHDVVHGANLDDLSDYRPGFRAAEELGVAAPLIECGLTKSDVRGLARRMGLRNWNRPAMACLATRIPYDMPIDAALLKRIDRAERIIRSLGAGQCRVRHHGSLARIEIDPDAIPVFARSNIREQAVRKLRELGYVHICLDLEGYAPGKMNREIEQTS